MNPRLRILIVSATLPYPPQWGWGIRVYQLLRHLAERHEVSLLCHAPPWVGEHLDALRKVCASVRLVQWDQRRLEKRWAQLRSISTTRSYKHSRFENVPMREALMRLLAEQQYDVVQVEGSDMMWCLSEAMQPVTVLDEHNIEYELLLRGFRSELSLPRKLFYLLEAVKARAEEVRYWRRADGCALTSVREEAIVRAAVPDAATAVVPNGVDPDYFRPAAGSPDPHRIVFTGLMSYAPNVDAVIHFVKKVLPLIVRLRSSTVFSIVGAYPPVAVRRLAAAGVEVTGHVDDVRPHLARAAVVVVPLRIGSGTRLKIGEALAMGKPVVSTRLGCEGMPVRDGEHVLVADEPAEIAAHVLNVLQDRALADELGRRGRQLAEERLTWSSSAKTLELFQVRLRAAKDRTPRLFSPRSRPARMGSD